MYFHPKLIHRPSQVHDTSLPSPLEIFVRSTDDLCSRVRLDHRRLEAAHQKYAVLNIAAQFPELHDGHSFLSPNISDTLQVFTPKFYDAFARNMEVSACS